MIARLRPGGAALGAVAIALWASVPQGAAATCVAPGAWAVPRSGKPAAATADQIFERAASRSVVLLGEVHDRAEHHRWQLHTLAALHARRSQIAIGFEMFPRRVQPVLDRWVAGELTEAQFLQQSDWARVWGFDASRYLPLFHFARMHRVPMIALNVERSLVREVAARGFDAVPEARREGVGRPEPPPAAYVRYLLEVFGDHDPQKRGAGLDDPAFRRFVESQTLWDRAMAEAIRDAQRRRPGRQTIAIVGRGHALSGAMPHQLRALGIADAMTLLPWEQDADCAGLDPALADAVFGIAPHRPDAAEERRPRLGVALTAAEAGVRIEDVSADSVAAAAGLKAGDVLLAIAGRKATSVADVTGAIARQAPGTWLPLRVRRDGTEIDIVAKFPPAAH